MSWRVLSDLKRSTQEPVGNHLTLTFQPRPPLPTSLSEPGPRHEGPCRPCLYLSRISQLDTSSPRDGPCPMLLPHLPPGLQEARREGTEGSCHQGSCPRGWAGAAGSAGPTWCSAAAGFYGPAHRTWGSTCWSPGSARCRFCRLGGCGERRKSQSPLCNPGSAPTLPARVQVSPPLHHVPTTQALSKTQRSPVLQMATALYPSLGENRCVCVVWFFSSIEQLLQRVVLPGLNNILPERNILEKVKFKIHKTRLGGVNFL